MLKKYKTTRLEEECGEGECEDEINKELESVLFSLQNSSEEPKMRFMGVCGDINDETTNEILYGLMALKESGKVTKPEDSSDPESEMVTIYEPFEMLVSTWGGIALNAFGIYDLMRNIREDCDIVTTGMGKVMSAGVLLLAAGTKGKRRIGANCRVMMHSVIGGHTGAIHNLENEIEETRWVQKQYIKALVKETNMTEKQLKRMLNKKVNIYLDAEKAVELGIADEII